MKKYSFEIDIDELKYKHKLISEVVVFPDVTSEDFYKIFNKEVLRSLGIVATDKMLDELFQACKYLPWQPFDDVASLSSIKIPIGILSNFNKNLGSLLNSQIPELDVQHLIVSEIERVAKPEPKFYQRALEKIGIPAEEILYVGDSVKLDIEPALKMGFQVALIDRDEVYKTSPYKLKSLKDIIEYI